MRSLQLALCAGAAAAAVIAPAPAAHADDGRGRITVTPSTIAPGGEVDLRVDACQDQQATGTSEAFSAPARLNPAADGGLFAEARIRPDARAKDYEVRVKCQDGSPRAGGTVTVAAVDHAGDRTKDHTGATPTAPVHAGGGGTSEQAAVEVEEEGPGTRHTVIGLVLAGVAAVAVAFRSVRRRRTTDRD
ncbi:hypothetical protein J7I98_31245 [Streptomyces sp. ISL-98]|uniref:hypothetical protein n=1 Tax=Streptomyces sp. ISL-98 TaxID=2819192 RepID=UPI001BE98EC2|nr:hypothetical protein [Streptomyces sp. ISL-98]MBT2510254.1 hypothetical protein [Streptomyces sp. ISL-98]